MAVVLVVLGLIAIAAWDERCRRVLGRQCAEHQRRTTRALATLSAAARRVDDRLTYYERRPDGLKGLRAGYDKRIAQIAKRRADDLADVAPEGTAQSEHIVD